MCKRRTSRRDFLRGKPVADAMADGLDQAASGNSGEPGRAPLEETYLVEVSREAMACRFEVFLNAGQYGGLRRSGDLLGQDALGQLTDQMKARGISKKHHGGLALLYLRLCKGLEVTSEQSRLAS